jgi:hypothetical protein
MCSLIGMESFVSCDCHLRMADVAVSRSIMRLSHALRALPQLAPSSHAPRRIWWSNFKDARSLPIRRHTCERNDSIMHHDTYAGLSTASSNYVST